VTDAELALMRHFGSRAGGRSGKLTMAFIPAAAPPIRHRAKTTRTARRQKATSAATGASNVHVFEPLSAAMTDRPAVAKHLAEKLCDGSLTPLLTLWWGENRCRPPIRQSLRKLISELDGPINQSRAGR